MVSLLTTILIAKRLLSALIVEEAFSILTEKEKFILYKCFWEGYTIAEIAKELDAAESTIYNARLRIYEKIKPYMKDKI